MKDGQEMDDSRVDWDPVSDRPVGKKVNRKGYRNLDNDVSECVETEVVAETYSGKAGSGGVRERNDYVGVNTDIAEDGVEEERSSHNDDDGDATSLRLMLFAMLNIIYVVLQLWGSITFRSLALLSDSFHNLSDVAAIGIAIYIHKLQRRRCPENEEGGSDQLPFGYKRAEVIGGLINSVALVALSAYVLLSAIPRLISPTEVESGWAFILLASAGVVVNLAGVLFFAAGGDDHCQAHAGGFLHAHSHSHDHGHELGGSIHADPKSSSLKLVDPAERLQSPSNNSFDHDEYLGYEEEVSVVLTKSEPALVGSNGPGARVAGVNGASVYAPLKKEAFLSGGEGTEHEALSHPYSSNYSSSRETATDSDDTPKGDSQTHKGCGGCEHRVGDTEAGDGYGGDEGGWVGDGVGTRCNEESIFCDGHHGLSPLDHECRIALCRRRSHGGGTPAAGSGQDRCTDHATKVSKGCNGYGPLGSTVSPASAGGHWGQERNGCDHAETKDHSHSHYHSHSHSHSHCHSHSHSHVHGQGDGGRRRSSWKGSMNILAVLVHAIVDAVSSGVICAQSAMIFFFGYPDRVEWTDYLDPATSIGLSLFIAWSAIPVIKRCSHVLLEGTPSGTDASQLRKELLRIEGVASVKNLAVIQLNSEDKHVAMITLAVEDARGQPQTEGGVTPPCASDVCLDKDRIRALAKEVIARYNVGRSTVEIIPQGGARRSRERRPGVIEEPGKERYRGPGPPKGQHGRCSGYSHEHSHAHGDHGHEVAGSSVLGGVDAANSSEAGVELV